MENLSVALKQVSEAVTLDSSGFQQAAFSKYIQSLQVLIFYLNGIFASLGFEKMLEKKKEVIQVLSLIHECSDRISVILNDYERPVDTTKNLSVSHQATSEPEFPKISLFEKVQSENMQLFKLYQMRLANARDKYTKSNLNLEFQRRLAENAILAKKKYEVTIKQLQKERVQFMESAIRKLYESSGQLSEKEKEKRELYSSVLQYVKTETWPISWRLSSYDLTAYEMAEKIFHKIIRCCEHPLSQWLILVQTNIKRKVDTILKEFPEYISILPDLNCDPELKYYCIEEHYDKAILKISRTESPIIIPSSKMLYLENVVLNLSEEISSSIGNILDIFYLVYKSLLPDESETVCYHIIEKYFLRPMWPNLSLLYRIHNISSEYKISESMYLHRSCTLSEFEVASDICIAEEFYKNLIAMLKSVLEHQSIVNKLKTLVQVSQKIGECETIEDNLKRKLGADELIPVLSFVVVQSRLPQLISECSMLELLFDMKYMLGEEGYALSTFFAALKCIEIMKLSEYEDKENKTKPVISLQ